MSKKVNVAILGATGAVGETLISILEERNFPIAELYPLARKESEYQTVLYQNKPIEVIDADEFDFAKAQIALFSAGSKVSKKFAPKARAAGCIVIDNTSAFRYEDNVPLVIPEVNPEAIAAYKNENIIANPNCSVIQMLVALKPIYDQVGIEKINVATYQAVSGSGKDAIKELAQQTANLLNASPIESKVYPCQIAFNVIPHVDEFQENGFTREEMKMVWETKKILANMRIEVNPTAVRVPVFYGHAEAVHIETTKPLLAADAKTLLASAPGTELIDETKDELYPTPISHGSGSDKVYVGRVRNSLKDNKGLNLWIVSDNVRKGAALNAVQIAEILLSTYF